MSKQKGKDSHQPQTQSIPTSGEEDEVPPGIEALMGTNTTQPAWKAPPNSLKPEKTNSSTSFWLSLIIILLAVGAAIFLQPSDSVAHEGEVNQLKRSLFYQSQQLADTTYQLEKLVLERGVFRPKAVPVEIRDGKTLSMQDFQSFANRRQPLVIKNMASIILPNTKWDLNHINKTCGSRTVNPQQLDPKAKSWARLVDTVDMTVWNFIQIISKGKDPLYLHDWSLPRNCPELVRDFVIPRFFSTDYFKQVPDYLPFAQDWPSLFVGPKGTQSALHVDSYGTSFWMLLLKGQKKWHIYSHDSRPFLYEDAASGTFVVDSFNTDYKKNPLHQTVTPMEVLLEEGDLIFVPAGLPHQVLNLEETIAVSMNFVDSTNKIDAIYFMLAEASLGVPGLDLLASYLNRVPEDPHLGNIKLNSIKRMRE